MTVRSGVDNQEYKRGIRLDIARLYHQKELMFKDQSKQKEKIEIIRGLIRERPTNGEYWVYHGIFQKDQEVKIKSFYKALQINPKVRYTTTNFVGLICTEQYPLPAHEIQQLSSGLQSSKPPQRPRFPERSCSRFDDHFACESGFGVSRFELRTQKIVFGAGYQHW